VISILDRAHFLAEKPTLRGYPATRSQIARLESSLACTYNAELLAAATRVLRIPDESVPRAMLDDYRTIQDGVVAGFS
jgi:hypothetical protein